MRGTFDLADGIYTRNNVQEISEENKDKERRNKWKEFASPLFP